MKTNAIIRIVIWSIILVLLAGILVYFLGGYSVSGTIFNTSTVIPINEDTSGETALIANAVHTVTANAITDMEIEWAAGSIILQPGDVETITFCETAVSDNADALVWEQKGSKLKIQYCKDSVVNFSIGINTTPTKDLLVTVPQDWVCNSLEIDAASAVLTVAGLTIREVEIDTASGPCDFINCNITSLDLDTASGDISFTGCLDVLDCDAASASFTGVLDNVPSRMDMDSMSGNLDITLPEGAGFTVAMDALSSDFSSDFETASQNGHHVCGDGSCRINVDAMSGDVIIRKGAQAISEDCLSETAHTHTDACQTDPDSCPDNAQHHTETLDCNTEPSTHHQEHDH